MKSESRITRANCKTPAVCNFLSPFPLTPGLSLRERESQGLRYNNSKRLAFWNALPTMLPLPEGEGRGEGERIVRTPERCHCYNHLTQFKTHPTREIWRRAVASGLAREG